MQEIPEQLSHRLHRASSQNEGQEVNIEHTACGVATCLTQLLRAVFYFLYFIETVNKDGQQEHLHLHFEITGVPSTVAKKSQRLYEQGY